MELTISKQYPFNFVALALETMGITFDERSLAKFDAYEVDAFLKERCERSSSEKEAIEWFTGNKATPPKESYKESLVATISAFSYKYYNGQFGLVSLADFDNLAMSWVQVKKLVAKIDSLKDDTRALPLLFSVREEMGVFLANSGYYIAEHCRLEDENTENHPINYTRLDSCGCQILAEYGINTVGDLTRVTADYLLNIKGFGERRLERVRDSLRELKVHLLGE